MPSLIKQRQITLQSAEKVIGSEKKVKPEWISDNT